MGNQNSVDYAARNKINSNQWTLEETTQQYKVLKNKNGILAEQYNLASDTKLNEKQQLEIYDFRRQQNQPVVKIYGASFSDSGSSNCCGKQHKRRVLTQRIPQRLSTIAPLTFSQALYTLSQSIQGYKQISKKLGPSNISASMIGITPEGRVKVWINDNWAQNHPPTLLSTHKALQDLHGSINQSKMIQNLFNIVQAHTQGGKFPQSFRDQISTQSSWNFINASNLIRVYAQQHNIKITEYIILVKSVLIQNPIIPPPPPSNIKPNLQQTSVRFSYMSGGNIVKGNNPIVINSQFRG